MSCRTPEPITRIYHSQQVVLSLPSVRSYSSNRPQGHLRGRGVCIYTFLVHNFPKATAPALKLPRATAASSRTTVRRAARADAQQILDLVGQYAAQGLMLPRTLDQIATRIDNYVVAADQSGRVVACAALEEYSPSLAEVSSVAVAPTHHGKGLGSQVVLGVERLARARDIEELFALSLTDNFFLSLSYSPTDDFPLSGEARPLRSSYEVGRRDRSQALLPEGARNVVGRASARREEGVREAEEGRLAEPAGSAYRSTISCSACRIAGSVLRDSAEMARRLS